MFQLKIREVAEKCKLIKTENGLKVDCTYTYGPKCQQLFADIEKHREELTQYLMNPDIADYYEWMESSHQTAITLKA